MPEPSSTPGRAPVPGRAGRQVFLFLQGPITPFFWLVADELERRGHRALRVNLCFGDRLFWRRAGAHNFTGKAEAWPAYISDLLDREGVSDLVLLGEQRYYHKVAIAAVKARGARVTVTDFGYLRPDWVTFEPDGMSGDSSFPRDPDAIMAIAARSPEPDLQARFSDSFFTQAIWDMGYHLSSSLFAWLHRGYRSHQVHHPVLVYLGTGLHLLRARRAARAADRIIDRTRDSGAPYYVLPLQMENDFQLRAYSPFPDMKTPIHDVISSFATHAPKGSRLLVKVHPLDPGLRSWARIVRRSAERWGVDDRIDYIDGGSLPRLLERARGVVTVNSTVGLWSLRAGIATMTLGTAIYDIEGLTYQGSLDRFWNDSRPPRPALLDGFVRAIAATIQIRGVYYRREGLEAAVQAAAARLDLSDGGASAPSVPANEGAARSG